MCGAETVVFALGALGEAGEAATGAQGPNTVTASGQDFMRISLMANIPDELVGRRVENIVQRDGQLDDAEARTKMSAGGGDHVDGLGAQLIGNLPEVARIDAA